MDAKINFFYSLREAIFVCAVSAILLFPGCRAVECPDVKVAKAAEVSPYPPSFTGIYFQEDFERKSGDTNIEAFIDKNVTGGQNSSIKIVTGKDGVPLTDGEHALSISGKNKYNGVVIDLPRGIPLEHEIFLKCDFWVSGAANHISLLVATQGKSFTHYKLGPASVKSYGDWATAIWRLNDFFPRQLHAEPEKLIVSAIRFVQRVNEGGEKPDGAEWHQLVVDNIVIASGKAAEPFRKSMEQLGGERYYTGNRAGVLSRSTKKGLAIWHSPSTVTVFEDQPLPQREGNEVAIAGARNEYESFQIVLFAKEKVENISVAIGDLNGPDDANIPSDSLRWHPVCYLPIRARYFGIACDQRWPAPLSWNRRFGLQPGKNQPVWFTVKIPEDIPPGDYKGNIRICAGEDLLFNVPLKVTVWDFDFPDRVTFRTNMQVWGNPMDKRTRDEIAEDQARTLAMYHMVDASRFLRYPDHVKKMLVEEYKINTVKIPFCGGHRGGKKKQVTKIEGFVPFSEGYEKAFVRHIKRWKEALEPYSLWDKAFLYIWDEPFGDFEVVKTIQYIGGLSKKYYPELQTLVAAPYYDEFQDNIDIFMARGSTPEIRKAVLAKGKKYWASANSDLYIDLPAIDQRMAWGLESIQNHFAGAYAWGIYELKGNREIKIAPENPEWPYTDPWKTSDRSNYNAIILWPGGRPESEPQRLVPSIPLELLRDGIEDYEYVVMLRKRIAEFRKNGKNAALEKAAKLLEQCDKFYVDPKGLRNDFRAVDELETLRRKIAEVLKE